MGRADPCTADPLGKVPEEVVGQMDPRKYTGFEYGLEKEMQRRKVRGQARVLYWLLGVATFVVLLAVCGLIGALA